MDTSEKANSRIYVFGKAMDLKRDDEHIVAWVARNILPYEAHVRARLRRVGAPEDEISDIIQDTYVGLSRLDSVQHIRNGQAYFMSAARMALLQRVRQRKIVRIDAMSDIEAATIADDGPGPDQMMEGKQELARVLGIIAGLPERCRQIFEMRRVQGVRQKEVATRLAIPEHIVEAQVARGLRLILKALAQDRGNPIAKEEQRRARH
ncbi:RNA polymerase sigma factor [Sphingomonas sp.]|uniref:RNA polymerase sigma factor n=1 Tax=Sphingomonas sp. TaxID=28214 RepID=UPI002DD6A70E|nr:sigma-70 family RNA polymerase sigma factor [Sphingomonas sp.]